VTGLLGPPDGTSGGFVTGATMANATCLAAARDAVLARAGWDAAGQPRRRRMRDPRDPARYQGPSRARRVGAQTRLGGISEISRGLAF